MSEEAKKKWYESKLAITGGVAVLGAVSDGLAAGWTWRQTAVAAIGALVIVFRVWFTSKEIGK